MLPTHSVRRPRRGLALLLISLAAGLTYAAQPRQPAAPPAAPEVSAPVVPAPSLAARPADAPPPPSLSAPTMPSARAVPAPPPVAAPAVPAAYRKLRLDMVVTLNGQRLPGALRLQTFGENRSERFTAADGAAVLVFVSGRPYAGSEVQGEDLILLEFVLLDAQTRQLIGKPRLITKDGVVATVETGQEGGRMLRIETLPRIVQTRLHDAGGALAELRRDIEAGKAPALYDPR